MDWQKNRHRDQWNRIKTKTQTHAVTAISSSTKESKIGIGQKTASSPNGARKTGYSPSED
jgi:hypothetical protein